MIHPSAIVEKGAVVAPDVEVGPFAIIEAGAEVASGCKIGAHAVVHGYAKLGEGVKMDCFSAVGGDPQDLSFDTSLYSGVTIGARTVLREAATVHRATVENAMTQVGTDCLLMATSHVGHDCVVGNGVIMANAVLLAGHVRIGDNAVIGGGVSIHQWVRVGERCMIGGMGGLTLDLAPFCMSAERNRLIGLNLIGLRRGGFKREEIAEIKNLFHLVFDHGGNPKDNALGVPASEIHFDCGRRFVEFFKDGKRSFVRKDGCYSTVV
jgi:UDP-N-acetylglucosamine acyltransferase